MINIYAQSLMIATRTEQTRLTDRPNTTPKPANPRRWLPKGHWWLTSNRDNN